MCDVSPPSRSNILHRRRFLLNHSNSSFFCSTQVNFLLHPFHCLFLRAAMSIFVRCIMLLPSSAVVVSFLIVASAMLLDIVQGQQQSTNTIISTTTTPPPSSNSSSAGNSTDVKSGISNMFLFKTHGRSSTFECNFAVKQNSLYSFRRVDVVCMVAVCSVWNPFCSLPT